MALSACKPGTPKQFIQPSDMEELLYDYHLAAALANQGSGNNDYKRALYWQAALEKHGYTQEQFDSSLVYYYTRADRFEGLYKRVAKRLDDRAIALGASESEIGKYATLKQEGDTANIWNGASSVALLAVPPYHKSEFELKADTSFRVGDTFLMNFTVDYISQGANRDGTVYLALTYNNDSIVGRYARFAFGGVTQMRLQGNDSLKLKKISGFFYLNKENDPSSTPAMAMVRNIQLVRFHRQQPVEPVNALAGAPVADTQSVKDSLLQSPKTIELKP